MLKCGYQNSRKQEVVAKQHDLKQKVLLYFLKPCKYGHYDTVVTNQLPQNVFETRNEGI